MKKIIITLGMAIAVFVVTLLVTNSYISRKSIMAADNMVMQKMDSFSEDFDDELYLTKKVVYGFLSANLIAEVHGDDACFYYDDSRMDLFGAGLKGKLEAFLKANPYYESVMMAIEDFNPKHKYYAPTLIRGRNEIVDLAQVHDFSHARGYNMCKNSLESIWALPTRMNDKTIICFYVPFYRKSNEEFLGTFSISLDISTINKKIEKHLPYGKEYSDMVIATEDDNIIASFPVYYASQKTYDGFPSYVKQRVEEASVDSVNHRKIIRYRGQEYFLYQRELKNAPWKILTSCNSKAVYAEANNLKHMVLITSLVGMVLMLLSCIVVMRMIYTTNRRKETAERELNMASRVQMSLLRNRDYVRGDYSLHAYLKPARQAGGDLYDYVYVDGKLIFCIGDVSGKGMPAALFMTQVMSLFRSAVKRSTDPSVIVSYINEVLSDDNPDMTFCTLFVGVIDGPLFTFANAGHDAPVLLPSFGSSTLSPLTIPGESCFPIGIESDSCYTSETYTLHDGDTILLYTDGVTEARDKAKELYGANRMMDALTARTDNVPEHCINALLASINSFVNGAEQSDDITILAISLRSRLKR